MDSLQLGYVTASIAALVAFLLLRGGNTGIGLRSIPGPPSPSWIFGNLLQLLAPYQYGDYEFTWQKLYGPLYRVKGCFGEDRLIVSDPVALQSIVNSNKFDHSPLLNNLHKLIYSKRSLLIVRDGNYRRLRAAFSSSFSAAGVRQYQSAMESAAEQLTKELELSSSTDSIDVCPLLTIATLSAISEAVIGCSTQELGDEFVQICSRVVGLATKSDTASLLMKALGTRLPGWFWSIVSLLPTPTFNELRRGRDLGMQIGTRIVQEKLRAVHQGLELGNDAFSRIVASDQWEKTMDAEELAAHASLLAIAGQETTAKTLAFALLELARNPELQDSLQKEVHASRGDQVAYNNMPLLNAFIKEVLRLYPIVPLEERIVIEDTVLPVSDKVTSSTGAPLGQIPIRKGQIVSLAIASYQRAELLWGEDAEEFKPSRWIEGTSYQGDDVGPYANLLTFFGGPRTCLGWRFAILEMQVIISELVAKFSFQLPEGDSVVTRLL
ncbi:cytochrome P450 [Roridomyces roridus]|uniref:Cytochrome P450 n=1 Tax=Roridomyces roridus TaxID=1738132 RepID=A0AAD7FSB0_9AGAR|nr:cytochrome P450 [Roridomyces roridus]